MHTSDAPYPSNGVGFSWLAINFVMACQDFYDESASFKKKTRFHVTVFWNYLMYVIM